MSTSTNGQDAKDNGAGPSSGLSLRERMRLKAQQKLQDQSGPSSSTSPRSDLTRLVAIDIEKDKEDDDLGSLTLGRATRQAALKRPASYFIDPLDDSSRLKRHPNRLPSSVAQYATSSVSKTKEIDGLLREQQRKAKRGTDAEGLSKADAIAQSMEQERLGRMGIAYSDHDDDSNDQNASSSSKQTSAEASRALASYSSRRNTSNTNREALKLTVKALSPTIPSYLWSSQSEAGGDSDEDAKEHIDLGTAEHQLAASLAAVGADEDEKQQALDILQQDARDRKAKQTLKSQGHITFYRSGKVLAPPPTFFCPLPSVAKNPQDVRSSPAAHGVATAAETRASLPPQPPSVSDELEWNALARRIILAGFLPPSFELDKRQIRRILVWLSISFILEHDVMQSRLISTLFQSLVSESAKSHYHRQLESAIPKALTDVVRRVPHILNRIGMDDEVFEQCFPDNFKVTDVPLFTVAQRKATASSSQAHAQDGASSSSPSAEFTEFKVYLTQAERDEILVNLARMLDIVACAASDPGFIADNVSIFAGYIASMTVACAATTGFALPDEVGSAFSSIFAAAAREGNEGIKTLQEEVCLRVFSALRSDSIAVRARLVTRLPGERKEVGAVRRWLAWCALTEHVAQACSNASGAAASPLNTIPSSDPLADEGEDVQEQPQEETAHWRRTKFEPLSIDLDMLVAAIDANDSSSPFYVAPLTVRSTRDSVSASPVSTRSKGESGTTRDAHSVETRATDFESIIAATQLLCAALRDLAIHMCSFDSSADRSTPTPSQPDGHNLADAERKKWPRALRLALTPYLSLNPTLDESRIAGLHSIVDRLAQVNSRIRDNRGNVILQTLAKDALQRTGCLLEYQLEMFAANVGGGLSSFIE